MSTPVAIVIEDEPQIRRFVRAALEAEGWQVFEADTRQRGLTEAGTRKPDLLVLDLGLPDSDGLIKSLPLSFWSSKEASYRDLLVQHVARKSRALFLA